MYRNLKSKLGCLYFKDKNHLDVQFRKEPSMRKSYLVIAYVFTFLISTHSHTTTVPTEEQKITTPIQPAYQFYKKSAKDADGFELLPNSTKIRKTIDQAEGCIPNDFCTTGKITQDDYADILVLHPDYATKKKHKYTILLKSNSLQDKVGKITDYKFKSNRLARQIVPVYLAQSHYILVNFATGPSRFFKIKLTAADREHPSDHRYSLEETALPNGFPEVNYVQPVLGSYKYFIGYQKDASTANTRLVALELVEDIDKITTKTVPLPITDSKVIDATAYLEDANSSNIEIDVLLQPHEGKASTRHLRLATSKFSVAGIKTIDYHLKTSYSYSNTVDSEGQHCHRLSYNQGPDKKVIAKALDPQQGCLIKLPTPVTYKDNLYHVSRRPKGEYQAHPVVQGATIIAIPFVIAIVAATTTATAAHIIGESLTSDKIQQTNLQDDTKRKQVKGKDLSFKTTRRDEGDKVYFIREVEDHKNNLKYSIEYAYIHLPTTMHYGDSECATQLAILTRKCWTPKDQFTYSWVQEIVEIVTTPLRGDDLLGLWVPLRRPMFIRGYSFLDKLINSDDPAEVIAGIDKLSGGLRKPHFMKPSAAQDRIHTLDDLHSNLVDLKQKYQQQDKGDNRIAIHYQKQYILDCDCQEGGVPPVVLASQEDTSSQDLRLIFSLLEDNKGWVTLFSGDKEVQLNQRILQQLADLVQDALLALEYKQGVLFIDKYKAIQSLLQTALSSSAQAAKNFFDRLYAIEHSLGRQIQINPVKVLAQLRQLSRELQSAADASAAGKYAIANQKLAAIETQTLPTEIRRLIELLQRENLRNISQGQAWAATDINSLAATTQILDNFIAAIAIQSLNKADRQSLISQLKQITVEYHDQYTANSCPHNGSDIATEVKCDKIEDSYQRQKAAIIGQVFERKDLPETKTFAAIRANLAATKTSITALSAQRQQKNLQAISNAVGAGKISTVVGKLKDYMELHRDDTTEATVLNCTSAASGTKGGTKGGAKDSVPCSLRLLPTATANQLGFIITTQEATQLGVYDLEHAMITMVTFENNNIMQLIVRNKLLAPDLLATNLYHQFSPATLTSYYQEFFKQSLAPLRYLTEQGEFPAKIQLMIQSLTALHKQPVQMMAETVNMEVRNAVSPKVRAICDPCWLTATDKNTSQYPHIDAVKNTLKHYVYYDRGRFVYTIDKFAIAVEAMSDHSAALQLGTISVNKDNTAQYNPLVHIATNQDINHILRIAMQEAAELSQMTERAIRKQYFLVSDTNIGRSAIFAYRLRQTLYQKGLLVDKDGHILCRVKSAASYQPAEKSWLAHIVNFLVPSAMAEGGDGNDNNESECEDKENTIWDENESECEAECLQLGMGLNDLVSFEKYFLQTLANVPNQQEQFNVTQVFPQNMPQLSDIQQMFAVGLSEKLSKRINPDGSLDVISVIDYFLGEWGLLARIQLGIYKPEVMQDLFIMIDGILEINFEDTNTRQKEQIYALRLELAKQILQQLRGPNIDIWTDPKYKPLITLLSQFAEPKAQEFVDQEDRNLLILLQLAVALDKLETDIQIDDQLEILNLIIDQLVNDQPLTSEQTALLTHLLDVHNPLKRRPDSNLTNAQISILQENILPSVTEALGYILRNRLSPEDLVAVIEAQPSVTEALGYILRNRLSPDDLVAVIEALYERSGLSLDIQASLLASVLIDWLESDNESVNHILQLFSVSTEMPSLSERGLRIIELMFNDKDRTVLFDDLLRNMDERHMAAIFSLMNILFFDLHTLDLEYKWYQESDRPAVKSYRELLEKFNERTNSNSIQMKNMRAYFGFYIDPDWRFPSLSGSAVTGRNFRNFKGNLLQRVPNKVKILMAVYVRLYAPRLLYVLEQREATYQFVQDNYPPLRYFQLGPRLIDYEMSPTLELLLLYLAPGHTVKTNDAARIAMFQLLEAGDSDVYRDDDIERVDLENDDRTSHWPPVDIKIEKDSKSDMTKINLPIKDKEQIKLDNTQKRLFAEGAYRNQTRSDALMSYLISGDHLIPPRVSSETDMTMVRKYSHYIFPALQEYIFGIGNQREAREKLENEVKAMGEGDRWSQPQPPWQAIANDMVSRMSEDGRSRRFMKQFEAGNYQEAVQNYFEPDQPMEQDDNQIKDKEDNQIKDKEDNQIKDKDDNQIKDKDDNQIKDKDDNQIKDKDDNQKDGKQNLNWMTDEAVRQLIHAINPDGTILEYQASVRDSLGNIVLSGNEYLFNPDQTGNHTWGDINDEFRRVGINDRYRQGLTTLFDTITNQQRHVQSISVVYNPYGDNRRALVWTDGRYFQMIAQEWRSDRWQTVFYDSPNELAGIEGRHIQAIIHNGSCGVGAALITIEFIDHGANETIFPMLDNSDPEIGNGYIGKWKKH